MRKKATGVAWQKFHLLSFSNIEYEKVYLICKTKFKKYQKNGQEKRLSKSTKINKTRLLKITKTRSSKKYVTEIRNIWAQEQTRHR